MDFNQARVNMVEQQIRTWDVLDQTVLDTVLNTPREYFVPDNYRILAFSDICIPLGHGQAMMTPKVEARLLQALAVKHADNILEIGTGSGYLTALLARCGRQVTSLEIIPEFTAAATNRLRAAGIANARLINADGIDGHAAAAPFDVIAVTGSCASVRTAFQEQLSIGGRLFVVIGQAPVMEALLITRVETSVFSTESLFELELEPLLGAETIPKFQF